MIFVVGFIFLIVMCFVVMLFETHRLDTRYKVPARVALSIGFISVMSILAGVCIGIIISYLLFVF